MTSQDVRWKQRFQNLEKAYQFLDKAVQLAVYDELQAAGLAHSFEFVFELSWKTLKDYFNFTGISISSPRESIKQAFASGLIADGHLWLQILEKRNELTHTYSNEQAKLAIKLIRETYFPAIQQLYHNLKEKIECLD